MIFRSILISFTLLTLCTLAVSESNETERETPLKRCAQVNKKLRPRFHLVRRCARSDARIVISAYFSSVGRCIEFAMYKRGLAINFGWLKGGIGHCEVLECPEHDTLGLLQRRENFDYYSLYANPLPSMDWVCVPKVGVFRIGRGEARAVSRRKCQEWALMPSPRNKTEGEKSTGTGTVSSTPGGQTGNGITATPSTARSDERFTQEVQPSNLPSSPAVPFPPTLPPPGVLPSPPVPPFPIPPPFDDNPFGPPLIPPDTFPRNSEEPAFWNPEYRLGDLLNASNATDSKPRETGRLANILSQDRTANITTFLKSKIGQFFPPVLVGMATVPGDEGLFATTDGEPLPCFRFRAWAPGHPLPIKYLDASLRRRSSTSKPSNQDRNVTSKANSTTTALKVTQTTKNETISNNGTINITISASQRKRDEMTLCVYIQRDGLWHTNRCSTRAHFLCEFLPSGGPCRDANSTDERAECQYEKIGTKEDRCSAWQGEMITTTMMPEKPEMGDGDMNNAGDDNKDDDNSDDNNDNNGDNNSDDNGDNNSDDNDDNNSNDNDNNDADEDNNNTDEDNRMSIGEQDNSDNDEQEENNNNDEKDDNNDNDERENNNNNDEQEGNYDYDEKDDNNDYDEKDDNNDKDERENHNDDNDNNETKKKKYYDGSKPSEKTQKRIN